MTLIAVEPARITIDPRRYTWCPAPDRSSVCQAPGCTERYSLQEHHIVPRSRTGGPLSYITVDGLVTVNVCMLCPDCHDKITGLVGGHKAAIRRSNLGLTPGAWLWSTPQPHGPPAFVSKLGVPWFIQGSLKGEADDGEPPAW